MHFIYCSLQLPDVFTIAVLYGNLCFEQVLPQQSAIIYAKISGERMAFTVVFQGFPLISTAIQI
jgi:hypothetical protein